MKQTTDNAQTMPHNNVKERHRLRQKRKKRRKSIFITTVTLLLLGVFCYVAMFFTPWFNVSEVAAVGSDKTSKEDIIAASGVVIGSNIFKTNFKAIKQNIESVPYVKHATVSMELPSKIVISIQDSHLVGYINVGDVYVGIDEDGKVLEVLNEKTEGYPIITGVEIREMSLGKKIVVDDSDKFDIILLYMSEFEREDIWHNITSLDVANIVNIQFMYENRLKVFCGDGNNVSRKLLRIKKIIQDELKPNSKGELDARIEGKYYYRP